MQISYKFTEEDQRKYLATNFNNPKLKIIPIVTIVLLIIALILTFNLDDIYYAIVITTLLLLIIFIYYINPRNLKNRYIKNLRTSGTLEETKTIELNENELITSSPSKTTSYKYTNISNISIVNDYFVKIDFKQGDSIVIPNSAFSSNDERTDFINQIKLNAKIK